MWVFWGVDFCVSVIVRACVRVCACVRACVRACVAPVQDAKSRLRTERFVYMYICKKAVNVNGRITEFILLFHNLKYELRLTAYAETKLSQINEFAL